jgi:pilus assembly protein CpaB
VRRKLIGIVGALLCALLGTVLVLNARKSKDDTATPTRQPVTVLVALKTLPAGTSVEKIQSSGDAVAQREVAPEEAAADALKDMASLTALKGKVLSADVGPNGQLKTSSFVDRSTLQISAGGVDVPPDRLQISFSLEPQRVLGGSLRAGDTVAVVWSDPTAEGGPKTHIIVQKALVANVQLANLANVGDTSGSNGENPAVVGNYMVTLGLSAPDVERLTNGLEFGKIWLAKMPETASGEGAKVWDPAIVASDPVTAYQNQAAAQ